MNCPRCHTPNPTEARFCLKCAAAMTASCPRCNTPLPAEARFCFHCGHQISRVVAESPTPLLRQYIPQELLAKLEAAHASGGMQGERRIVTMLFCDVKGSTEAAERLDPEEWAEIMNGAFEHLISPVYRYEGTLARLMGDAILAFFGAPIAHEDDPQRSVLAGLDILQRIRSYREQVKKRWGLDFDVRVGINTGLVVVGEVGSDLRVEYTALGDAVNLAARMEQTAQPGTVQVSENTYRLVAPLFEWEDLGGVQVKGKQEPVRAYRALRPKVEPGLVRGLPGLQAPLLGREREMSTLRHVVADLRQGRGQIVSVMGEAGLGKSRLIAELRKALRAEGLLAAADAGSPETGGAPGKPPVGWYEGRSLSYQNSTPYASFVDLLSSYFGLQAEAPDASRYDRIAGSLAPERVLDMAPFLASLLGIGLTGEALERVKYLQPPQLRDRVFRATRALVASLLHIEGLPEKLRLLILKKSEGNPFFLEEVIRSLLDSRVVVRENSHWRATREIENMAVPDTLSGVITARLDRLDEPSKRVVQTASVIGRDFPLDTLSDVHGTQLPLDGALAELQRRGLVREKSQLPQRVYTFKHALTQETVYASLLLSRRRELHRRVAECLEPAVPDRVTDIGRHFLEALERVRALPYLVEAGERAARAYSTPEAIQLFSQAIAILDAATDGGLARRAYEGLGGAWTFANDIARAMDIYKKMFDVARTQGDMPMQVSALNKMGYVTALQLGEIPRAEQHLVEAERLARQCDDLPGLAELHMTYCYIRTATGDFDGALDHQKESLQIGRQIEMTEAMLFGMAHIANTLTYLTRFEEAWQTAQEALQQAEKAGHRRYTAEALTFPIPVYHLLNGDRMHSQNRSGLRR